MGESGGREAKYSPKVIPPKAIAKPTSPSAEVPLTAEEMWGGVSEDDEEPLSVPPASVATTFTPPARKGDGLATVVDRSASASPSSRVLSEPAVVQPSASASRDATRLQRILAGSDAPAILNGLNFDELAEVADDCEKAAETLRFVLQRQRELVASLMG